MTPKTWKDLPILLTTKETSALLRISEQTIKRLCQGRKLPAEAIGRQWRIDRDRLHEMFVVQNPAPAPDFGAHAIYKTNSSKKSGKPT